MASSRTVDEVTTYQQEALVADTDSQGFDNHSDYGTSLESDTTSLRSSLVTYEYENGRRYKHAAQYVLPNDEEEQRRLDVHYHVYLLMHGGTLHWAPLSNPQRVLDLGTGTGIWALDMAEVYPSAEVIGVDISPIQPSWVLPNCRFEIDDVEKDWTYPPDSFDFIRMRNIAQSVRDWPRLLRQVYKALRPGGYVEICEEETMVSSDDNTVTDQDDVKKLCDLFNKCAAEIGLKMYDGQEYGQFVKGAGFKDIQVRPLKVPWGIWPKDQRYKEIGRAMLVNIETAFQAYCLSMFTRQVGMSRDEAQSLIDGAVRDCKTRSKHGYGLMHDVVGRKPVELGSEGVAS